MGARKHRPANFPAGVICWYPETRAVAEAIRVALRAGATQAHLARQYGLTDARVGQIAKTARQLDALGYEFPAEAPATP